MLISAHKRIDVLPHDFSIGSHFEKSPPLPFTNKGVAAGKPLGAADMLTEEGVGRSTSIFPDTLVGTGIKFDYPRIGITWNIHAVREQSEIAVIKRLAVVLHAPAFVPMLPLHFFCPPVNDDDRAEPAKANHQIAVRKRGQRVGMGEFIAPLSCNDGISLDFHIPAGMPLPGDAPCWRHFIDAVAVHEAIAMRRIGNAARDNSFDFGRYRFPSNKRRVAVREPTEVMMLADVAVFPDHATIPIILAEKTAAAAHALRSFGQAARP